MGFVLTVLGVILIIEGIPYFAFPKKAKGWALLVQEIPDRSLRIMGVLAMLAGLMILYAARFL